MDYYDPYLQQQQDLSGLSSYLAEFALGIGELGAVKKPVVKKPVAVAKKPVAAKPIVVKKAAVKPAAPKVAAKPAPAKPAVAKPAAKVPSATTQQKKALPPAVASNPPAAANAVLAPYNTALRTRPTFQHPAIYDEKLEGSQFHVNVDFMQKQLIKHGAQLKADKTYGTKTVSVWQAFATRVGQSPRIERGADKFSAVVDAAAWGLLILSKKDLDSRLKPAAAAKVPAKASTAARTSAATVAKPTSATNQAYIKISVESAQQLIRKLGAKLTVDKKYGPTTAKLWSEAAKRLGQDTGADRASATEMWVHPATFAALNAAANKGKGSATPATKPATSAKPTDATKEGMVQASVGIMQDILKKLGVKLTRDGNFGPATRTAWMNKAKAKKLDGSFDRAGPTSAWIVPATYDALAAAARMPGLTPINAGGTQQPTGGGALPAGGDEEEGSAGGTDSTVPSVEDRLAVQMIALATQTVTVQAVQKMLVVARRAAPSKFGGVEVTGSWDEATQAGYASISQYAPGIQTAAFERALSTLLAGQNLRVPPAMANAVTTGARIYDEGAAGAEKQQQAQQQEDEPAAPAQQQQQQQAQPAQPQYEQPAGDVAPAPVQQPQEEMPRQSPIFVPSTSTSSNTNYPPAIPAVDSTAMTTTTESSSESTPTWMIVGCVGAAMLAVYLVMQQQRAQGSQESSHQRAA